MKNVIVSVVLLVLMVLPVRLAAYWFKAPRQGWGRSLAVIFLGAILVNVAGSLLPSTWLLNGAARFGAVFLVFVVVSSWILDLKLWQAAVLALFIATFYSFGMSEQGKIEAGFG